LKNEQLLWHGAVELLRVRRRTVVNVNERLRLEGDVCQRRPICAMKTEPLGVVKGLFAISHFSAEEAASVGLK